MYDSIYRYSPDGISYGCNENECVGTCDGACRYALADDELYEDDDQDEIQCSRCKTKSNTAITHVTYGMVCWDCYDYLEDDSTLYDNDPSY